MPGFLYIVEENADLGFRNGSRQLKPTGYSKIGITNQLPYQRLRMLSQGNPRILSFKYMWVGPYYLAKSIEDKIKGGSSTEWFPWTAEDLRTNVIEEIVDSGYSIYELNETWLPYSSKRKGACRLSTDYPNSSLMLNDLYNKYHVNTSVTNTNLFTIE